ncbi:hypothetical protein KCTCHS21_36590 [Cohnella abietis]|uniref:Uncharacterized protein n=1 Tax=Cohnella abietis TaxID=2507935 RepID=A0A3T1D850_9BACL|nr:hypothetical protein KCTCHS21_36590 [Cohnella abietis]
MPPPIYSTTLRSYWELVGLSAYLPSNTCLYWELVGLSAYLFSITRLYWGVSLSLRLSALQYAPLMRISRSLRLSSLQYASLLRS